RRQCLWRVRQDWRLREGPSGPTSGPRRHHLSCAWRAARQPSGLAPDHYGRADPRVVRLGLTLAATESPSFFWSMDDTRHRPAAAGFCFTSFEMPNLTNHSTRDSQRFGTFLIIFNKNK